MARVMVCGGLPESLLNFRGALLQALVGEGHEVIAVSPQPSPEVLDGLRALGVGHHVVPLSRTGLNPLADLRTLWAFWRLLRREKPHALLAYTIKPVVYGGLAARIAGVPFHALITGLGYTFSGAGRKAKLLGCVARNLYRRALARAATVFFQNADNAGLFRTLGLCRPAQQCVVPGSGIDVQAFAPTPLPASSDVLMIARLLYDKGVREFVEAARQVRLVRPDARFRLAGWLDDNPAAIRAEELEGWVEAGYIEYLGHLKDVRPALAEARIYCLPSYHEGMPRTVLEAMACGRPVVTTDIPGCRDAVDADCGICVPVADAGALAQALLSLLDAPGRVAAMGLAARHRAEKVFDVRLVNERMLRQMGLVNETGL